MSFAKREMERQEGLLAVATEIAIEMGALERCENDGVVKDLLAGMNDEVRDEALARFRAGEPEMEDFKDEAEVAKVVEEAFNNAGEECPCSQHLDD
jgi:hypothetical protein